MKTYVLDTNILLSNPEALFSFEENEVILPSAVVEELDNKKRGREYINANAREVARKIYALKQNCSTTLFDGVDLGNGGKLYVAQANPQVEIEFPSMWDENKKDNDILKTCLYLQSIKENDVILVTKDVFLSIKADFLKIKNEDYKTDSVADLSEQYTGQMEITLFNDDFLSYCKEGSIETSKAFIIEATDDSYKENFDFTLYPNQFLIIHNANQYSSTKLGKVSKDGKNIVKLVYENEYPFGVTPRNASQKFMQEALMSPVKDCPLVIIKGPAGTAKTFYSLAVALERLYNNNNNDGEKFRKALVCRPYQLMDEEIGFLPGTEKEKIAPLFRGCYDNLEVLVDSDKESRLEDEEELQGKVTDIFDRKLIDFQSVGYLRGRSIESQIVIVDECFTGDTFVLGSDDVGYSMEHLYNLYQNGEHLPQLITYNEKENIFENKPIVNVVDKGLQQVYKFRFANRIIKCTKNHPFLTLHGWKKAQDLELDDVVITTNSIKAQTNKLLNDDQYQIMLGSYLGDGHISKVGTHRYRMREAHTEAQKDYITWKASMFQTTPWEVKPSKDSWSPNMLYRFQINTFVIPNEFPDGKKGHIPQWVIDDIDYRAIAIWYMDDGSTARHCDYLSISTHSFDLDSVQRLSKKLMDLGIQNNIRTFPGKGKSLEQYNVIYIPKAGADVLIPNIIPYMHESMMYKVRNRKKKIVYLWDNEYQQQGAVVLAAKEILDVRERVYDIEVADNHNFAVIGTGTRQRGYFHKIYKNYEKKKLSGLIVHNCQNLTPKQAKAIVTRAGEGTKVILLGDCKQIDNQYLSSNNNGLSYLAETMKGSPLMAVITTDESDIVRSPLAKEAIKYLESDEQFYI